MKRVFAILFLAAVCAGCEKSGRIYRIGDFYYEPGKQGIVFYVTDEGRHGKIVSLDETQCVWATEAVYEEVGADGQAYDYLDVNSAVHMSPRVLPEAYDYIDGMKNMKAVRSQPGWRKKYPAFAWCADKGDGWYLPAQTELLNLYAACLFEYDEEHWCWSSTSLRYMGGTTPWAIRADNFAHIVDMRGSACELGDKNHKIYVRAIAKF